jgi:hypothetical protein
MLEKMKYTCMKNLPTQIQRREWNEQTAKKWYLKRRRIKHRKIKWEIEW